MAIVFRSAGTIASATATPLAITLNAPAGMAATDVVVAVVQLSGGGAGVGIRSITAPAGWTLITSSDDGTGLNFVATYWALGSVSFANSFTLAGGQTALGLALAYIGVNNTTPVNVSGGQINASSTIMTAPSITTTVANAMLVGVFCYLDGTGGAAPTFSGEFGTPRGTGSVTDAGTLNTLAVDSADAAQAVAGASGTKTATSSIANVSIGQLIALSPAAVTFVPDEDYMLGPSLSVDLSVVTVWL